MREKLHARFDEGGLSQGCSLLYPLILHFSWVALPVENDVSFRPLHIRLLGSQAVMLQADAVTKLLQQFWGTGRRIR